MAAPLFSVVVINLFVGFAVVVFVVVVVVVVDKKLLFDAVAQSGCGSSPNDDAWPRHCSASDGLIHSTDTLMASLIEHLRNTSICSLHPLHWSSSQSSAGRLGAIRPKKTFFKYQGWDHPKIHLNMVNVFWLMRNLKLDLSGIFHQVFTNKTI